MKYYSYEDPELNIEYLTKEFAYAVVCKIHTYSYPADRSFTINEPEFRNGKIISGYVDHINFDTSEIECVSIENMSIIVDNIKKHHEISFGVLSEESEYGGIHNYRRDLFDSNGLISDIRKFKDVSRDDLLDLCKKHEISNKFLYRFAIKYEDGNVLDSLECPECNSHDTREYHIKDGMNKTIVCDDCGHSYNVVIRYGYYVHVKR